MAGHRPPQRLSLLRPHLRQQLLRQLARHPFSHLALPLPPQHHLRHHPQLPPPPPHPVHPRLLRSPPLLRLRARRLPYRQEPLEDVGLRLIRVQVQVRCTEIT